MSYLSHYHSSLSQTFLPDKDHIILTVCATGEGSAIKLKHMIEEKINLAGRNIKIIPMPINDQKVIVNRINKLSERKKILAIVGSFNPNIYGIPFIPTSELFSDPNLTKLKEVIQGVGSRDHIYDEMFKSLARQINNVDMQDFQPFCMDFLARLERMLNKELGLDKKAGLILHLAAFPQPGQPLSPDKR